MIVTAISYGIGALTRVAMGCAGIVIGIVGVGLVCAEIVGRWRKSWV